MRYVQPEFYCPLFLDSLIPPNNNRRPQAGFAEAGHAVEVFAGDGDELAVEFAFAAFFGV